MSNITNCPNCQTQFIVTDDQLNQHNGKVRCGHCLNVFDAKIELVNITESEADIKEGTDLASIKTVNPAEVTQNEQQESPQVSSEDSEIVQDVVLQHSQANYFEAIDHKAKSKSRLSNWLLSLLAIILFLAALAQSLYYWRSDIAIYYPKLKPLLTQLCEKISCNIQLPKKIEFIIIDDSDMREDEAHEGFVHFSTTLINQAAFNQTYPNIELTLTDIEDKPKFRRIFTPAEYLPEHTDITRGLPAGAEIKVKLALTAQDKAVAGYRLSVSY
ncbi:MAG: DUF3426 domain-containing protein [Methylotenera sp.]|uniref:DUF3426 domain-containing protein n=1 Tax=Methylotenera sp. TaxID=2051956 RepID=UPI0024874884|nr:DUF3426 domain-containing protein [Methylotenera sp.]MDI1309006.1 DUF3426 domain-containing protein [Methylotenera sp.]